MKSKMFKRVLAAMLAASSVMAMSGVAMATKKAPGSGKNHGASKNPAQSDKKVMKLKKIKARGKRKNKKDKQFKKQEVADSTESTHNWKLDIYKNKRGETLSSVPSNLMFGAWRKDIYDDEKSIRICGTKHFYTAAMGGEDMLSQDCCNDKFVLQTTNEIRRLKHSHHVRSLKDCRKGKEQELVDALISWAKSDNITVKRNIAVAIGDLAEEGFFDDLPQEKKKDVLGALVNCVDHAPSTRPDVAWAFKRLVGCGFVNGNENSEEGLKLQEILNDCEDSCDVEPHLDMEDYDSDSCEI